MQPDPSVTKHLRHRLLVVGLPVLVLLTWRVTHLIVDRKRREVDSLQSQAAVDMYQQTLDGSWNEFLGIASAEPIVPDPEATEEPDEAANR